MLTLVHCCLMRGILLIVICGSSSLMPQGQKAIKGHCLLDYTRLMAAHLEAKAEAPEPWLTAETQIWTFCSAPACLGLLSWPLYPGQSACHLPQVGTQGDCSLPLHQAHLHQLSSIHQVNNFCCTFHDKFLGDHKTASFPIPMQSIGIWYIGILHIDTHVFYICIWSDASTLFKCYDPFLIKS